MELELSNFLIESKKPIRKLIEILSKEYKYVSVLGTDCFGKKYSSLRTETSIENSDWNERGFVLRIYNGINYSEFSFDYISKENVEELAKEINEKVKKYISLFDECEVNSYPVIDEEEITKSFKDKMGVYPKAGSDEDILNKIMDINKKAMGISNKILNVIVMYNYLHVNKIFISNKKDLEQSYLWSEGIIQCITSNEEDTKFNYKVFSGLKGVEIIDEMKDSIKETVDTALKALESEPIVPGMYEVICSPDVSGLIAHEAFGHGVEMDMFLKERAKAKEYMGHHIASPLVTMRDGASSERHMSSYLFDDEGVLGQDTVIIDKGVLKCGISDTLSAVKLGSKPTGNGKRESFERKAYSRMTNTFFEKGYCTVDEMIKSINYGFLLDVPMSGMEDPRSWGIQCMVNFAYEIKDGKLTGKIFSPIVLTGYVPDLLKSISMVSDEINLEGSGACGKGYKEYVKVSSGGPYIKARVRLG